MKFSYTTNKDKRNQRRLNRLRKERVRVAAWHRKFAWLPLKITIPEDLPNHSTAVWFEWVVQKAHIKDWQYSIIREYTWTRYTEKEYFKKKLDGTLEPEEKFSDMSHDGPDTNVSLSLGKIIKKGGPYDNNKYKRMTITRNPDDGTILNVDLKLYDENGKEIISGTRSRSTK